MKRLIVKVKLDSEEILKIFDNDFLEEKESCSLLFIHRFPDCS